MGGGAPFPTMRRGTAIYSGSWPFGACKGFLSCVMRPVPTSDAWLGASSSAVGRGMCVVDGSIHYIGCWHFGGGEVLLGVGLVKPHLTAVAWVNCG